VAVPQTEDAGLPLSLDGLTFAALELDERDHVFTITLNRPAKKNALNEVMITELVYALDYAREAKAVRVVVIAAKGDIFCAGGDLKAMSGQAEGAVVSNVPKRGESDDIPLRLHHLGKPSIARIQGSVFAGALLMVCSTTHAIAAEHAQFSAPEIRRGIWPFQVMAGLFRVVPRRAGLDFIMRGQPITAADAAQWGLINEVVPADQLDTRVTALADELAALAPGTMRMGLEAFRAQEQMPFEAALPYLKAQLLACLHSEDAQEGIAAFLEKRAPNWT